MKKIISMLIVCLILTFSTYAQSNIRFGVKGGFNLSSVSLDNTNNPLNIDESKALPSFNVGIFADLAIAQALSLQPSLTYSGKGYKSVSKKDKNGDYVDIKYNPFYVDFQTNLLFKIPFSDEFKFFVGAGPYLAMATNGKASIDAKVLGLDISKKYDINFTSNNADLSQDELKGYVNMKRFDVGGSIVAGVELGKIIISLNYEHGLVNIQPGTANNDKDFSKNRSANLSLGFLF